MGAATTICLPQRQVHHCMGTVFSFDVRAPGVDWVELDTVVRWLHWVDATFSTYRADSQISRLDRGEITLAACAPEVGEVLERCRELEAETDGYFSVWAEGRLDPSGLVKGWAIQRASQMLSAVGSTNHCVNGGGDVQCVGSAAPGRPWRIGVADPLRAGALVGVASGHRLAVATSGNAERGAHVLDPHTGASPAALASVTITGSELATVDAYATAAYAMGRVATDWVSGLVGYDALIVHADGTVWTTPGFH
jgi:thiamine biosynthesis lipoprotein